MTFTGLDIKMLTFPDIFRFSNDCGNPYFFHKLYFILNIILKLCLFYDRWYHIEIIHDDLCCGNIRTNTFITV